MSNILITGSHGFIGSHLVDALRKLNHNAICLDNLSTGRLENLPNDHHFIEMSINDNLEDVFEFYRPEYVFHLAAQINVRHSFNHISDDATTNIMGSLNVLENCVKFGVKRVIFSSTGGAIYDPNAELPWIEISQTRPQSPYGIAKLSVENYLDVFEKQYGLKSTILRFGNVYGGRQNYLSESGVISIFINKALKNEELTIFGGEQSRDFIYIDNVIAANLLALNAQLDGIYNVGGGIEINIKSIAEKIIALTNSKSVVKMVKAVDGELLRTNLNCEKLLSAGWRCFIDFDEGLKKTVEWFKEKSA